MRIVSLASVSIIAAFVSQIAFARPAVDRSPASDCSMSADICNEFPVQKILESGVSERALSIALGFFQENNSRFSNHDYMSINDFTIPSGKKRMYLIDLKTGDVETYFATHGRGSDAGDGRTGALSDSEGAHTTPPGFMVGEFFQSPAHGRTLLLHGLESRNRNAADRMIEIHGAWYASESFVRQNGRTGRSFGCVAVDPSEIDHIISVLDGGLVYNYDGE